MELTLIRHGMTSYNESRRYLGRTDAAISEKGRAALQNRAVLQGRADVRDRVARGDLPDFVFSGPMRRCLETANILYGTAEILLIPEWTEMDFGVFEGRCYEELKDDKAYCAWLDSGCKTAVLGGESREDFIFRSMRGYERMLGMLRERAQDISGKPRALRVAAVVHGGTIMALGSSLFGGDYFDYQLSCGGEYHCPVIVI